MALDRDPRDDWGLRSGTGGSGHARDVQRSNRQPSSGAGSKKRTPKNPDAFLINAEQVGLMIGMQEIDARELMERGVIQSYWHRSHLKSSKQDVEMFLSQLREGLISVPNVLVPVAKDLRCFVQKGDS